jgi:hypothetical protein
VSGSRDTRVTSDRGSRRDRRRRIPSPHPGTSPPCPPESQTFSSGFLWNGGFFNACENRKSPESATIRNEKLQWLAVDILCACVNNLACARHALLLSRFPVSLARRTRGQDGSEKMEQRKLCVPHGLHECTSVRLLRTARESCQIREEFPSGKYWVRGRCRGDACLSNQPFRYKHNSRFL